MPNHAGEALADSPQAGAAPLRFASLLAASFRAQAAFLLIAFALVLLHSGLVLAFDGLNSPSGMSVLLVALSAIIVLGLVLVTYLFIGMALHDRPKHPARELLLRVKAVLTDPRRMALGIPVLLSLVVFMYAFSNVKGNIPAIVPFSWDPALDRWDAALHFGRRPWEWLQPVLGHWPVTMALNIVYNIWFVLMYGVWLHFAFFAGPGPQRTRYFLTFMLLWFTGGSLLALLFSSAGPCFFGAGRLGLSPDPYAGLMAYLRATSDAVPLWAVSFQDLLWSFHLQRSPEASISAMPSMHNGTTLLFVLASRGWPRWIRLMLIANVVAIFLGSIHLGWHYAVDSYVAWPLTLAIWWAMGPVSRWLEGRPAAKRFRAAYA